MKRIVKFIAGSFLLFVAIAILWLGVCPPELLRVGTGYAAKIVCSNVFIAGRDADDVLAVDVQAPGNPLLKFLNVSVEENTGVVTARIFGFFAPSKAIFRPGFGCANVHTVDARPAWGRTNSHAPQSLDVESYPELQRLITTPQLAGPGMRAIAVMHNGRLVAETYADGFSADTPLLGWSATKSVRAILIGMRIAENRMDMADSNLFPEWEGDGRSKISLANLMAMESGLKFEENYGLVSDVTRMLFLEQDMAGYAASLPLEAAPGTTFSYSSGTANILSKLFMMSFDSPEQALSYPSDELFGPLGMNSAIMETDASGGLVGSSYMYATARDWARLGSFLADGGSLHGKQILPTGFVDLMRKPAASSGGRYGSGQVWLQVAGGKGALPEDTFWMSGHDGQSIMVVPSMRLAVVRLGLTPWRLGYKVRDLDTAIVEALR
ncbi:serine hydrolase [Brucella sp. BE17]|uniref:serine hydrolase domain-containing protein n=1 Tax=Brucella sp. BE17 TaxID=3142977 RepID=UPI0031B9F902